MTLTRRTFLGTSATAAFGAGLLGDSLLSRAAGATPETPATEGPRALVVLQLAGGNDGLNTVVPYADPLYRKLRPTIGLGDAELLKLDERVALHASLSPLRDRFQKGTLAIVQGVGYPRPDRSHFVSTAIWQTARREASRDVTGWLGRAVDLEKGKESSPLVGAVGIGGGGLTPAFYAQKTQVPSLLSLEAFTVQPDRRYPADAPALKTALASIYGAAADAKDSAPAFVGHVGRTALEASDALRAAVTGYSSTVTYPRGVFGDQLRLAAQILLANLGVRVFHVTLGGFDTHANQKPQQRNLFAQLGDGIAAFLDDLAAHGRTDDAAVLTYSEFGRRAAENGSAGTDHGSGSVLFLAGSRVAGGLHGPGADLSALDGGDVPMKVDFRSVYASILRDWLKVPPEKVLGPGFGDLRLFTA